MKTALSLLALIALLGASDETHAQAKQDRSASTYPARPVRFIVTFTPGAINDLIARTLGNRLTEMWGQQVVVDNRAGCATIIGTELAARSAPDGHTLILFSIFHGINPSIHAKLPFDVLRDFASVSLIGTSPFVLVVLPSVPARNLKEFIALAKARPGELAYGSSGIGGAQHLMYEMLALMAGIRAVHVPYKGGAPMLNDVIAGRLQFTFLTYSTLGPHVNAGRARALAVTSRTRAASTPDIPSIAEEGYPEYDATPWWGIAVPAGTPRPLIARLHADIVRALQAPDVRERFIAQGIDIVGNRPEEMHAYLKAEIARWSNVVKAAGIKPD